MPIPPVLPTGFIELTSPVAYCAHALLLMIAHTPAFQAWCGVSRWQDACQNVDLMRGEVEDQQTLLKICDPFVLLELPKQSWASLDSSRNLVQPLIFDIGFTASAKHDPFRNPGNVALSCLEFSERVGRLVAGIMELSDGNREGSEYQWPSIHSMQETEIPLLLEVGKDGDGLWNCRWQITAGGVQGS